MGERGVAASPPMALLAEVTHRCPLRCFYCSNPLTMLRASAEMTTDQWRGIIDQAAALGVLQIHFSGGEPLVRQDIAALVRAASQAGIYVNLITSGLGLTEDLLRQLIEAGLDHVQLSFQDADGAASDRIGGLPGAYSKKRDVARMLQALQVPMTLNFVIHRQNIAHLPAMLLLAETLAPQRVEIAHTQFYGWGLLNRDALLPDAEQVALATTQVELARARTMGRMTIDYVTSDYHAAQPKPCMGGWAQRFIVIAPDGTALPCQAAQTLPGIVFPSARDYTLHDIWYHDAAFGKFRGQAWMQSPCTTCAQRDIDYAGCRCQALALTADAAAADPVCVLSAHRHAVDRALDAAHDGAALLYRGDRRAAAPRH